MVRVTVEPRVRGIELYFENQIMAVMRVRKIFVCDEYLPNIPLRHGGNGHRIDTDPLRVDPVPVVEATIAAPTKRARLVGNFAVQRTLESRDKKESNHHPQHVL